jgi:hypothetical protein
MLQRVFRHWMKQDWLTVSNRQRRGLTSDMSHTWPLLEHVGQILAPYASALPLPAEGRLQSCFLIYRLIFLGNHKRPKFPTRKLQPSSTSRGVQLIAVTHAADLITEEDRPFHCWRLVNVLCLSLSSWRDMNSCTCSRHLLVGYLTPVTLQEHFE